jgi:hypothetical protein
VQPVEHLPKVGVLYPHALRGGVKFLATSGSESLLRHSSSLAW